VQRDIRITHTATGNWYGQKKFELRNVTLTYTTQHGEPGDPIERFDVVHHRVLRGERTTSSRRFVTESERAAWVGSELKSIDFDQLPEPIQVAKSSRLAPLASLVFRSVTYDERGATLACGSSYQKEPSHQLFVSGELAVREGIETARPTRTVDAQSVVGLVGRTVTTVDEYTDTGLWLGCEDGRALSILPGLRTDEEEVAVLRWSNKTTTWTAADPLFSFPAPAWDRLET
jgi:hypothetical protein